MTEEDGYFDERGDWVRAWRPGDMRPRTERLMAWLLPILLLLAVGFVCIQTFIAMR